MDNNNGFILGFEADELSNCCNEIIFNSWGFG